MTVGTEKADGDPSTVRMVRLVAEVLQVPTDRLGPHTAATAIEEWDSFAHVRIVLAVEQAFGVVLSMGAIERADSVGGLVEAVEAARSG